MSTVIIKKPRREPADKEFSQKDEKIYGVYLFEICFRKKGLFGYY